MMLTLSVVPYIPGSNFCGSCNRLRVTADGQLKVCLFGADGLNILHSMRGTYMMRAQFCTVLMGRGRRCGLDVCSDQGHFPLLI
jgi:molybdenum cofactor biosynthesis enzyme MoaA